MWNSNNNTIAESNICHEYLPFLLRNSTGNIIYANNITTADVIDANFWDNGAIGNYWSGYSGADSDGNGIGDTAYVVDIPNNIDNYPLMYPYNKQNDTIALPNQSFPTALVAVVSAVSIAAVAASLLYYRKKNKQETRKLDKKVPIF